MVETNGKDYYISKNTINIESSTKILKESEMSEKFKKEFKAFTLRIDPRVLARWQSGADLTGLSLNEYLCLWLTRTMLEGDEFAHALHKILSGQDNKRSAILDLLSDIQIENQKLHESYFGKILTETMNDK